jgi:uncharacterized protein YdhG (YjbR/CyaY superfamily)
VSDSAPASVDAYISSFPPDAAAALTEVRHLVAEIVPEATETISYDIPTFDLDGRHLVHFAAWEKHLSIYPVPRSDALTHELQPYRHGKGTLRFPFAQPVPYELIGKVVTALVKEARR